jgi:TrmH family RNA methyltransferase
MLSKNRIRELQSLHQKKFRQKDNLFIAEGRKIVAELINSSFSVTQLYATSEFIKAQNSSHLARIEVVEELSLEELQKISVLQQAQDALAVCKVPEVSEPVIKVDGLYLFLDSIRDPGNLGTLIRVCEWFNVDGLFMSQDCVEWTNPKVIQASMGSFIRVQPIAVKDDFWTHLPADISVISADLDGDNLYTDSNPPQGILIISSESHGLSPHLEEFVKRKIHIPAIKSGAESLNAAIAASIILSDFTRRRHWQ